MTSLDWHRHAASVAEHPVLPSGDHDDRQSSRLHVVTDQLATDVALELAALTRALLGLDAAGRPIGRQALPASPAAPAPGVLRGPAAAESATAPTATSLLRVLAFLDE